MAEISGRLLTEVDVSRRVLATLYRCERSCGHESGAVSFALIIQLARASASGGYADLASSSRSRSALDLIVDKDLSLHEFVVKAVTLPADPADEPNPNALTRKPQ